MLTGRDLIEVEGDIPAELCPDCSTMDKPAHLDRHANHHVACNNCKGAIAAGHDGLNLAVKKLLEGAPGCTCTATPDAVKALGRDPDFPEEYLNALFPKDATKASGKHDATIASALDKLAKRRHGEARRKALDQVVTVMNTADIGERGHGRIVDLVATAEQGEEMWTDKTFLHSTAPAYRKAQLKWHKDKHHAEQRLRRLGLPVVHGKDNSPALTAKCRQKHLKYQGLLNLASIQCLKKRRKRMPEFIAGGMTHDGEVAGDLFRLCEWAVKLIARRSKPGGPLDFGRRVKDVTAEFRHRWREALQVSAAKAVAYLLTQGGRGGGGRRGA